MTLGRQGQGRRPPAALLPSTWGRPPHRLLLLSQLLLVAPHIVLEFSGQLLVGGEEVLGLSQVILHHL